MRHPADRFLLLFTGAATLFVAAITGLYAPGVATSFAQLALLIVLISVAVGRFFGVLAAAVASLALSTGVYALTSWPFAGSWWWSERLPAQLVLLAVSSGCGIYVALLTRQSEQAQAARRDVSAAADLGVGLVPQALNEEALGTLLTSIERMANARCVSILVPADGHSLSQLSDGRCEEPGCSRSSQSIAELMRDSFESSRGSPAGIAPVLTSSADLYLPVLSSSGLEGVLHADRAIGAGRWSEAETGILGFAADLLGALLERDRLQARAASIQAMEEADALKANILLSISHELRTPLTASSATVASLIDAAERHDDHAALEDLQSIAEDLTSLDWRIGELIDSARLDTANWKPNIDWNDGSDLLNVVLSSLPASSQARLRCEIGEATPPFQFDLVQMARALHHLVENALSYSPTDSGVLVSLSYDAGSIRISVSDNGPGVTAEEHEAIFHKFYRGTAGALVPHGTGLGLAIASGIVAAHGGTIEVENVKPTGARFTIVLARRQEDSDST